MAGEIRARGPGTGRTVYATLYGSGNSIWNTSGGVGGLSSFSSGAWTDYAISLTEQGVSNVYQGDFPLAAPAGHFDVVAWQQIAGSPAQTDVGVAMGSVEWNGSQYVPLSNLATSGQVGSIAPIRLARGVQVNNFPFKLVSAADHVTPYTSGVVSGQIARDAGAFGALQSGLVTERGLGWYDVQLTSGDMLANSIKLVFTANGISGGPGSDQRDFALLLQKVSGSV